MVKIRLARQGRKKLPIYRIIAADSRARRDGRYIESLGQYRPLNEENKVALDEERVMYWLGVGAQPSTTVRSLLSNEGILLKWHLQKKKIEPARAEEILNTWKAQKAEKAANKMNDKQRAAEKKRREEEEKKAAEAKAAEEAAAAEAAAAAQAEAAQAEAEANAAANAEAPTAETTEPTVNAEAPAEAAPEAPAAE